MPGTPMDRVNGGLTKLQTDNTENGRQDGEDQQRPYRPEPAARELTQTDRLNKRLLQSLLERMNKSKDQFERFMEQKEEDDEESSEFDR